VEQKNPQTLILFLLKKFLLTFYSIFDEVYNFAEFAAPKITVACIAYTLSPPLPLMDTCVYSVILSYILYNALFSRINACLLRDIDYRNQTYLGIERFYLYNNIKVLLREVLQKILNSSFAKRHQLKI
jgi:hypothetical protein